MGVLGNVLISRIINESITCGYKINKGILSDSKRDSECMELLEELDSRYSLKYEQFQYWNELYVFWKENGLAEKIVRIIFFEVETESVNAIASRISEQFINDNTEYSVHKKSVFDITNSYARDFYNAVLGVYFENKDSQNIMRIKDNSQDTNEKIDELREMVKGLTFAVKNNSRLAPKNTVGLHAICIDENLSYYEKEKEYIIWAIQHNDADEAMVYIAHNCSLQKDYERAIFYYKTVADRNREEYQLYNNIGSLYIMLNDNEKALASFEYVLSINKEELNARYNKAIVNVNMGRIETAYEWIKETYKIYPNDSDVVSLYAGLMLDRQKGYVEEAEKLLKQAVDRDPSSFYCKINLGYALLLAKKFDEAIELLLGMCRDYPNSYDVYAMLGNIYAMRTMKKAKEAIEWFNKAYEISKDEGYLNNIQMINENQFFDSVVYNGNTCYVYTDRELIELARKGL